MKSSTQVSSGGDRPFHPENGLFVTDGIDKALARARKSAASAVAISAAPNAPKLEDLALQALAE